MENKKKYIVPHCKIATCYGGVELLDTSLPVGDDDAVNGQQAKGATFDIGGGDEVDAEAGQSKSVW